jgi:hypothetical protein
MVAANKTGLSDGECGRGVGGVYTVLGRPSITELAFFLRPLGRWFRPGCGVETMKRNAKSTNT